MWEYLIRAMSSDPSNIIHKVLCFINIANNNVAHRHNFDSGLYHFIAILNLEEINSLLIATVHSAIRMLNN